ncbi:MAG TPA: hypothetical protein VM935_19960 [Chitinophagaceae bacterium]|jgi:hypothetical protein|nr:hypothetical protein [Chitinophagaceae bacterium]
MENSRGEERRNGQPDYSARGRDKGQAPTGFEGMNFEQRRRPYGEGKNTDKDSGDRSREFNERENS